MEQSEGILGRPCLAGLPDAVLARICEQFCPHCAGEDCVGHGPGDFSGPEYYGTLGALVRVNKRIGQHAQLARLHSVSGGQQSLPKLVRTLVERPSLGDYVRVVRLGDGDVDQTSFLDEMAPRGVQEFWSSVAAEGGDWSVLANVDPKVEAACLNTLALFKLAKHIRLTVVLGEWPLAVFSNYFSFAENRPTSSSFALARGTTISPVSANSCDAPMLRVFKTRPFRAADTGNTTIEVNLHAKNPLVVVHEWHRATCDHEWLQHRVCLSEPQAAIARAKDLGTIRVRGGIGRLETNKLSRHNLSRVHELDFAEAAVPLARVAEMIGLSRCGALRTFKFAIASRSRIEVVPSLASSITGADILGKLVENGHEEWLETVVVDTAGSDVFTVAWEAWSRHAFHTFPTLAGFATLRGLTVSADLIWFPSMYPRVLLVDKDRHNGEHPGSDQRLVNFLPGQLQTLAIVGIYAIPVQDVKALARHVLASRSKADDLSSGGKKFPNLRRVRLRAGGTVSGEGIEIPYDVPESQYYSHHEDWEAVENDAVTLGACMNTQVAKLFRQAKVEYDFDKPEFFFDAFCGSWDDAGWNNTGETDAEE
ncbi:hypothetical protein VTK26DRAFT_2814 [Humicola hyalothermophila]